MAHSPQTPERERVVPIRPVPIHRTPIVNVAHTHYHPAPVQPNESHTEPTLPVVPPVQAHETHVHIAQPERIVEKEKVVVLVQPAEQKELGDPNKKSSEPEAKTIRQEPPNNSETIQPAIPNNSADRIVSELLKPTERAPQAAIPAYKKKGKVVGRQRKYEQLGNKKERPIRELILYRHHTGKHWPGQSDDMTRWYERFYFTKPKKGAKDYEQHKAAYERGRRWIADDSVTTTGAAPDTAASEPATVDTGNNVVAYRKRSASS